MNSFFQNNIFKQIISIGALGLLLFAVSVFADWTAPPAGFPTCPTTNPACNTPVNIGPNVGGVGQTKTGDFTTLGKLVANTLATADQTVLVTGAGNVGIGIALPTSKLHVVGASLLNGIVNTNNNIVTGLPLPTALSDLANKQYVDAQVAQPQFKGVKQSNIAAASTADCGAGYVIIMCGSTYGHTAVGTLDLAKNAAVDSYTGKEGPGSTYGCPFDVYGTQSYTTAIPTSGNYSAIVALCMKL
jgi:hypothetical protein